MPGTLFRISHENLLVVGRRFPEYLGYVPGPVTIVDDQTVTLGLELMIRADQRFRGRALQKRPRLGIQRSSQKIIRSRVTHVELDRGIELDQLREYRDEMDAMVQLDGDPDRFAPPDIDSYARYLDLNEVFHSEIVKLAKSPMLRRALDQVTAVPFASPSALLYVRSKLPRSTTPPIPRIP